MLTAKLCPPTSTSRPETVGRICTSFLPIAVVASCVEPPGTSMAAKATLPASGPEDAICCLPCGLKGDVTFNVGMAAALAR